MSAKRKKQKGGDSDIPLRGGMTDRYMRDLHEVIAGREFKSMDELNAFLAENFGGSNDAPVPEFDTPQKRAMELVYDSWEAPDGERCRDLAAAALEIDPNCSDAMLVLAGFAASDHLSLRLVEQAFTAAALTLGHDRVRKDAGQFWGIFETRPYMRARFALAQRLWDAGEDEAAISHATSLLQLNPADNQGVRNVLVGWLLSRQERAAAAKLLRQFDDDRTSTMEWARALQAFQAFGAATGSRIALLNALYVNPTVAAYVLGVKEPPTVLPDSIVLGGEGEAAITSFVLADAWRETDGALDWLVEVLEGALEKAPGSKERKRPRL